MELVTTQYDGVLILTPTENRLDAMVAQDFKKQLINLIGKGNKNVLLNLKHVEFVDSSGLGALVSGLKMIRRQGDLRLCSLKPAVRSVFELTRLHRVFKIFDTEEEGLASF